MQITGYKCFNEDLINRYGKKFEVGKIYRVENTIKFGLDGNGYHLCKNMEDTLRYFDAINKNVDICEVIGSGETQEYYDDYYGYYNMYAASNLEIVKKLTREEIITIALELDAMRVIRFLALYKLNEDEINLFRRKFYNEPLVQDIISYYQECELDVFVKRKEYKHG